MKIVQTNPNSTLCVSRVMYFIDHSVCLPCRYSCYSNFVVISLINLCIGLMTATMTTMKMNTSRNAYVIHVNEKNENEKGIKRVKVSRVYNYFNSLNGSCFIVDCQEVI